MSRRTEAKTARRNKRRAARDARWIAEPVLDELTNGDLDDRALRAFDGLVTARGWTFDEENLTDRLASWYFEPSGAEVDDGLEPVSRIWVTIDLDDEPDEDDFPNSVHLLLVGTADEHRFTPENILDQLDAIESYRSGDPKPVFA